MYILGGIRHMTKVLKLRITVIIIYLMPMLLTVSFTRTVNKFLLSAGIMTVLLGLSMKLIPNCIGYKKETDKDNTPILTAVSGLSLILLSTT